MTISVTPIPSTIDLTAPAFTLGTANAAGTEQTAVASDATLLVFDTTIPSVISTATVASSAGTATTAPRRDHVHGSTAVLTAAASKAWAKLSQSGSQSLTVSYNCSSIADAGVGLSTVSFTTAFSSSNFVTIGSRENGIICFNSPATGSVRVDSRNYAGGLEDTGEVYFAAFGSQ